MHYMKQTCTNGIKIEIRIFIIIVTIISFIRIGCLFGLDKGF